MPDSKESVFVVGLQADNFMRLRAVRLELPAEGGMTVVGGRNEQGKSTVLRIVEAALGGKAALPSAPVRTGEDEGSVAVTLSDGTRIERTFTTDGRTAVKVTRDGMKATGPQALLDGLLGPLSYDPVGFDRLKDADKAEQVRRMAGLDLSGPDARRRDAYDRRTEVGRVVREREGQLAGMPPPDPDAPDCAPDVSALAEAVFATQTEHAAWDAAGRAAEAAQADVAGLEAKLAAARETLVLRRRDVALRGGEPDVEGPKAALRAADTLTVRFRAACARRGAEAGLTDARREQARLTEAIQGIDAERDAAIRAASLPVEGLGFDPDDGALTLDGLPYSQASQARRLRTSLAIAEAMHPRLRVLLVRDGNPLDDDGLRLVAKWARDRDMHVLIEHMHVGGATGVIIEDGEVVVPAKQPARMRLPGNPQGD